MGLFDEMLEDPGEGMTPGNINGVAVGVIKENWDSKHPGMVKVEIALGVNQKNLTDWMPVAVPYAGKEFGTYFHPEIGSQVLVAFHLGDINCPVVIGCMWNQTDTLPPDTAAEKNTVKAIRTKGGHKIIFSEESGKEKITVETAGKLQIVLDDENNRIAVQDEKGDNGIWVDAKTGEMTFASKKKVIFKVNDKEMFSLDGSGQSAKIKTQSISLEAGQGLKMKAQSLEQDGSSTTIKGQNIKVESGASLGLKGNASLKAESSGITEVKGAMVKLN